nr:hypothetical protein [uncultured Carboxylicivirga sp.]
MGFFKKIGKAIGKAAKGVGRFAGKVASTGVGKTVLSLAATAVAGPIAGAGVAALTKAIGKTKAGEMVSKVVSDGVVKVDKVVTTLKKNGIEPSEAMLDQVVTGVKAAAEGISEKPVSTTGTAKQALSAPSFQTMSFKASSKSSDSGNVAKSNFMDKVKAYWSKFVAWLQRDWKKILLFVVLPLGALYALYVIFKPKSNRRKRRR